MRIGGEQTFKCEGERDDHMLHYEQGFDNVFERRESKCDPRGKIDSNFAYEVLVRRKLIQFIYLFAPQEADVVGNSR